MDDLAKHASVSNSTVRDFEAGRRVPIANNLTAIRRALEAEGIVFLFDGAGAGVGNGITGPALKSVEGRPPESGGPRRPARVKRDSSPSSRRKRKP
jgi:transcriptional regulator with XRE-family HTH domain